MKRNISKLVLQVGKSTRPQRSSSFKIETNEANLYANKILVDSEELSKPTRTMAFIEGQMNQYPIPQNKNNIEDLKEDVRSKVDKKQSLQLKLSQLNSSKYSILDLQDLLCALKIDVSKEELSELRPKLRRLEYDVGFKLEEEELDQHVAEALEAFIAELNFLINKTTKVY